MRKLLAILLLLSLPAYADGLIPPPGVQQSGSVVATHCAQWTASGVIQDSGSACGSGGGGSPGGSTNSVQYRVDASTFGGIAALTDGQLIVGQTGSAPLAKTLSGDCTLAASGAITCTKSSGTSFGTAAFQNTGTSGANIPFLNGNNTYSGTSLFTGGIPSLANGNASIAASSTKGAIVTGQGSVDDLDLQNKSGSDICLVATGTTTLNCTGLQVGGVAVLTGNQSITLSGDVSGSGSTSITTTVAKVNGVAYAASPSTNSLPLITASNTATYTSVGDCQDSGGNHLNYNATTHTFSCGTSGSAASLVVGSSTVGSGTNTRVLFDNNGVLGEYVITGTGNVAMSASPTFTGTLTAATSSFSGHMTIEGVTSTGATGTGNFVFSASPTFTGTVTGAASTWSGNVSNSANILWTGTNSPGATTKLTATQNTCTPNGTTNICPLDKTTQGSAGLGGGGQMPSSTESWSTAIGFGALSTMQGVEGYYVHNNYAQGGNGMLNVAVGTWSMGNANANGCSAGTGAGAVNVAVGTMSLTSLTCGTQNVSIGEASMQYVTTGQHNTIVGNETVDQTASSAAMSYNSGLGGDIYQYETGNDNTAVGWGAMGYHFGANGVSGSNAAFGEQALQGDTATPTNNTGTGNTAIGTGALFKVTSGSSNTALGLLVGKNTLTTGSNDILIGVSSACDASSSSASNELHICGTAGDSLKATGMATLATEAWTLRGTLTLTDIATDATHTDRTICQDSTSKTLFFGSGTLGICLGTSSSRFKHDILPQVDGLAEIESLKPVNFFYNKGYGDDGDRQQYGFLAEDVVHVLPKLVGIDKDGRPNSVDILGMVPVLVKAVQQQQKEIEATTGAFPFHKCFFNILVCAD